MSFWLVKCQNNLPKSIRAPAIPAAVVDFVNSQTVKHEKGTRHEPRNVQNWKRGKFSSDTLLKIGTIRNIKRKNLTKGAFTYDVRCFLDISNLPTYLP